MVTLNDDTKRAARMFLQALMINTSRQKVRFKGILGRDKRIFGHILQSLRPLPTYRTFISNTCLHLPTFAQLQRPT